MDDARAPRPSRHRADARSGDDPGRAHCLVAGFGNGRLVGIASADTATNTAIIAAIGVSAVVLGFFAVDTLPNDPWTFVAIMVIALLAVVLDAVCKRPAPTRPASMRVTRA